MNISTNQSGFSAVEGLLVIAVLIVIGGAGFFVYQTKHDDKKVNTATISTNKPATAEAPVTSSYSTTDAKSLVSDFYSKYTATDSNAKQLIGQYGTANLLSTYENAQEVDPILCAQGTAPTTVTGAVADGSNFDVTVNEAFNTPQTITVKVTTQSGLKIDSVVCN